MKNSNVLLGILGGMAAGALAGILFAPDKGSKTRKKLKLKASNIKEDLQSEFDGFIEKMEGKYEELAEKASDVKKAVKK